MPQTFASFFCRGCELESLSSSRTGGATPKTFMVNLFLFDARELSSSAVRPALHSGLKPKNYLQIRLGISDKGRNGFFKIEANSYSSK